jgi:hypothetical protein
MPAPQPSLCSDDDSVDFYLLDTLYKIFSSIIQAVHWPPFLRFCEFHLSSLFSPFSLVAGWWLQEGFSRKQNMFEKHDEHRRAPNPALLENTPQKMLTFCFDHLHHTHSVPVRHAAALCIGVLSRFFLAKVEFLFTDRLKKLKKDKELREYASYQKAVKYLDFGVATRTSHLNSAPTFLYRSVPSVVLTQSLFACLHLPSDEQYELTMRYLTSLLLAMKNVERGVLRQEICASLKDVFTNILNPDHAQKKKVCGVVCGVMAYILGWSHSCAVRYTQMCVSVGVRCVSDSSQRRARVLGHVQ